MSNIFFTSDTHYHHKNIVRGTTEWKGNHGGIHNAQNLRDFDTLEEHDAELVESINSLVKENDILYHLGDWSFGGYDQIELFRRQINCKNIHFIYGNHDHHIEKDRKLQNLFLSTRHYKEITIEKNRIILCHFAMRVWNKSHHGSWMLYGHSHGTLEQYSQPIYGPSDFDPQDYRTMDVGVDTNKLFPYHYEDIRDSFKDRPALLVDHHNSETN